MSWKNLFPFLVDWTTAFEASPSGSDDASQGDNKIIELKEATRERIEKEHTMDLTTGVAAGDGWHVSGSAVTYTGTTEPTTKPDGITVLDADDNGRLYVNTTTSKVYYYKHGTGWVIMGIQEFPIGGTYIQVDSTAGCDPGTLFGGTWSNVSIAYAGLFMRFEGGIAASFGNIQAANLSAHTHTLSINAESAHTHPVSWWAASTSGSNSARVTAYSNPSKAGNVVSGPGSSHTHTGTANLTGIGTDLRPINRTVRIWKRTA